VERLLRRLSERIQHFNTERKDLLVRIGCSDEQHLVRAEDASGERLVVPLKVGHVTASDADFCSLHESLVSRFSAVLSERRRDEGGSRQRLLRDARRAAAAHLQFHLLGTNLSEPCRINDDITVSIQHNVK
jgi:hypothetical protein